MQVARASGGRPLETPAVRAAPSRSIIISLIYTYIIDPGKSVCQISLVVIQKSVFRVGDSSDEATGERWCDSSPIRYMRYE